MQKVDTKYSPLHSTSTGAPLLKYDPKIAKEIESTDALNGILRGYMADPSQIVLYPINIDDVSGLGYKDLFLVMNTFSARGIKKIDKTRIANILKEPDLPLISHAPADLKVLQDTLEVIYDAVRLDPQGAIDNLPAYYNLENKYYTLRELYKRGANIVDFFIPSSATGMENEAEYREQARKNLENNTAEEIRTIVLRGYQEAPTMIHKSRIPLLRAGELPHANDEIKWLVQDVIREGSFNSIIGAAKAGKSQCAMQLSFCLKNGIQFMDTFDVQKSEVLYVDFELEDYEIKRRYDMLREHYGLEEKDCETPYIFAMKNKFTSGTVDMEYIIAEILNHKKEHPDIKFVVFDCYYTFSKGDSNSEEDVWKTLQPLKALSGAENDLTVLYVHHTNKNGVNNNNAIYASGGSGLHGKVVDTSIVIYPLTSGREHTVVEDMFCVTAVGRTGGFKPIKCDRSQRNNYYFIPVDEESIDTTNAMTQGEFMKKFPKTWDAFKKAEESGKDSIGWSSGTIMRKDIEEEIKNAGYKTAASVLVIDSNLKKAKLPRFIKEITAADEASIDAAKEYLAEACAQVEENKV